MDMMDADLAEQRKANKWRREAERRLKAGVKPRGEYLAALASCKRPWEAEGIARATWFRRQRAVRLGPCQTIVTKVGTNLVSPSKRKGRKGYQWEPDAKLSQETSAEKAVNTSSSPHVGTDPVSLPTTAIQNPKRRHADLQP